MLLSPSLWQPRDPGSAHEASRGTGAVTGLPPIGEVGGQMVAPSVHQMRIEIREAVPVLEEGAPEIAR